MAGSGWQVDSVKSVSRNSLFVFRKPCSVFRLAAYGLRLTVYGLLLTLLLSGCGASEPVSAPAATGEEWWRDAVFYEIFVRSFRDSDRDGMGDLNGIIEKLDYLNDGDPTTDDDLGITALWLMPVTEASSYHGYDTVDYYAVEEDYGTADQFRRLVDEAHRRGIRVIVDLVINHTSSLHPWFIDARSGPDAEFRDWYVWIDDNPTFFGPWGQIVWHQEGAYHYFGLFDPQMPDLNYGNTAVTAEMYQVARFWLTEMNVDGFRLDAARHLIEDGEQMANTPATRDWLIAFREYVQAIKPDAVLVGEFWDETYNVAPYIRDGAVDLAFEFRLAEMILLSINERNPSALRSRLAEVIESYPPGQYATFLTNHDMDRVMSALRQTDEEPARAYLAATILFTLPGTPFIYYGEEIGMSGARGGLQPRDESLRTPMQWAPEEHAGFTEALPWLRVNDGYLGTNVAVAGELPDSLLHHYKALIRLRQEHIALRRGGITLLESNCNRMFGYLRHFPGDGMETAQSALVLLNVTPDTLSDCAFTLPGGDLPAGRYTVTTLLGDGMETELVVGENGRFANVSLLPDGAHAPHSGVVLLLQKQ